jgi:ATP-binding cassette subfamily C protein
MKPSVIICDEATSALDNRTQAIVSRSLDKLKATRIVVAHRLSTIRNADRIIVLDQGRVAESGTFDELLKQNGIFASMVKRQVS